MKIKLILSFTVLSLALIISLYFNVTLNQTNKKAVDYLFLNGKNHAISFTGSFEQADEKIIDMLSTQEITNNEAQEMANIYMNMSIDANQMLSIASVLEYFSHNEINNYTAKYINEFNFYFNNALNNGNYSDNQYWKFTGEQLKVIKQISDIHTKLKEPISNFKESDDWVQFQKELSKVAQELMPNPHVSIFIQ